MMTATLKLLSVLISLAMMLTGTYGVEAPEAASRTLTLSNVSLTVNGESVTLNPSVSLGVASEAGKALYDVAMNLDGNALFPVQVAVTEENITALAKSADVAVTVPAEAINSLVDSVASQATVDDPDGALTFMTQEFLPAYMKALKKVADPEFQKEMSAKSEELLAQVVDRGAGEPDVVEIDGDAYDVTTYDYTLTTEQMVELIDLVYASDEDLNAMYTSLFKFYDMLPEDSGLNGMDGFGDLFEKTGMEMTANIVERRNDDGTVNVTDAQIIYDFSGIAGIAGDADEDDEDEDNEAVGVVGGADSSTSIVATGSAANLQPMVIDVHSEKLGDNMRSTSSCEYEMENVSMTMEAEAARDAEGTAMSMQMQVDAGDEGGMRVIASGTAIPTAKDFTLNMSFDADGDSNGFDLNCSYNGGAEADTADWRYDFTADMDILNDGDSAGGSLNATGVRRGDDTAHTDIAIGGDFQGMTFGLTFAADIGTDPIDDTATGHEGLVIDDLSKTDELMQDETAQGMLMQVVGSFTTDAGTLMKDGSVTALSALFDKLASGELVVPDKSVDEDDEDEDEPDDDEDDEDEIEEDDGVDSTIEYSNVLETDSDVTVTEPEDDGALPYQEPAFGYLPEGMAVQETDVDTAYDSVTMSISDADYRNIIIATFSPDRQEGMARYTMDSDGNLVQMDNGAVQITQTDPGSWIASLTRDGVTAELYVDSETIDAETIAQILNGLTF